MDSVDKVISLTRCEDYFFFVISKGSSDDTEDTGCKRAKGRETPNPEAQLRQALTVCGGRATFEKLNTTFQKLFETSFTWKSSTPCKNNHNPGFPENIKVENNTKGKKFWTFSIDPLPKVGVPVQFELKQQGLSQLLQALAYFGGFCKSRQLKKYFSTWLKADFETEWILKHFGVKDVYSLAFVPEVSAKICILPKDEKNKRFCFQLNGVDRVEAGVSQLKDALEACGGAATLDELKKKFLEKFYTPCDSLWMKSTFGVENYTILESVPSFKSCAELIANPEWIFRLRRDPKIVAEGKRALFAVFDALDGQCTVEEFVREYGRQCNASFYQDRKKYFNPLSRIGHFLGEKVIVTTEPRKKRIFTLVNKVYEGRRRMLAALRETGDIGTEKELDDSYKNLFGSSLSFEFKEYFGVDSLEKAVHETKKVLILHKPDGVYVLVKPDLSGLLGLFSNYRANLPSFEIWSDEDQFNNQCHFLLQNVNVAISRCEQPPTIKNVCKYFASLRGTRPKLAVFLKSAHPNLLKFMMPDKASLFDLPPAASSTPHRFVNAPEVPPNDSDSTPLLAEFYRRMVHIVEASENDVLLDQFAISYNDTYGSDFAADWPEFYPSAKSMLELSNRITPPLSLTRYNSTWRFQYAEVEPSEVQHELDGESEGVVRKKKLHKMQWEERCLSMVEMEGEIESIKEKKIEEKARAMTEYIDLENKMLDRKKSHRSNLSGHVKR